MVYHEPTYILDPVLIKVRGDFLASATTAEILVLRCEQNQTSNQNHCGLQI